LASSTTSTSPLALLLQGDRPLFNWLESAVPNSQSNPQFNPIFSGSIQIPNLGFTQLLTQLPTSEALLVAIANPENGVLTTERSRLLSYSFEASPIQLISMLLGNELATSNQDNPIDPATDSANRRLATAFNFLLTSNGDTVTAFLRAIGVSTTEKSGFAIAPDQLSNLKN
ncbi:MAG: hypothetical protein LH649_16385, partial [Pseudanabaena sp. CAN_BIN31]|nr:hypothetical protein [Pseudanabaena sp. CAN_BIN31]